MCGSPSLWFATRYFEHEALYNEFALLLIRLRIVFHRKTRVAADGGQAQSLAGGAAPP
jgi:hypothetical protein